ncbi:hypothetical protein D3H64_09125 [Atopobacter sp. AH10]|uniref:YcaO-like family protein n=1 Tax=Atopobacter sp. AH10 TaxID=2315861 RepID=UPI000EF1BC2D|nr:YcaO-like family protein [Atopobacter sp. AH10]RLK62577.1 hypothetical protein D3H64_09125 [Atopobacter sp. AH10]
MYLERDVLTSEAIHIAEKILADICPSYSIRMVKSKNSCLYAVEVVNNSGEAIAAGKGRKEQALAGALFEAIEHHYYCDDSPTFESKYIPIETLRSKNSQLNDMLPIRLYKKNKDVEVVDIMHVHTGEKIPFPLFLIFQNAGLCDEIVSRYATNNGFAVGLNPYEAKIHAINEVLERNALSTHLVETFLTKNKPIRVVRPSSLTQPLRNVLCDLEQTIHAKIHMIDMTEFDGFYSYYVWTDALKKLPLKGSGTSQNSELALFRAMSELFQSFALYTIEEERMDDYTFELFKSVPQYRKMVTCDYKEVERVDVDFMNSQVSFANCKEQYQYILTLLKKHHLNGYEYEVETNNEISCYKIIVLEADNFQVVNQGVMAIPRKINFSSLNS